MMYVSNNDAVIRMRFYRRHSSHEWARAMCFFILHYLIELKVITDYSGGKVDIDLSAKLSSCLTPVRKPMRCPYHKIVCDLLFGTSIVNPYLIWESLNNRITYSIIDFREKLIKKVLSNHIPQSPINNRNIIWKLLLFI